MHRPVAMASIGFAFLLLQACSSDWVKTQYADYRDRYGDLDTGTIAAGLKEALEQGTKRGVAALGRAGGYLDSPKVRIPAPDELRKTEQLLRNIGAGRYADQFIISLNRAAEAAVPQATSAFVEVIRGMSIADAVGILKGADDAATQYFRRHSEARLTAAFRPIVARATARVGVTARYKQLLKAAHGIGVMDTRALDLDAYVTRVALDGLYLMIAQEERRIRQDPVARTTELLKKVFG